MITAKCVTFQRIVHDHGAQTLESLCYFYSEIMTNQFLNLIGVMPHVNIQGTTSSQEQILSL